MPDKNGKLTDSEEKKVKAWLITHSMSCPMCQSMNWDLGDYLLGIPPLRGGKLQTIGEEIPVSRLVELVCMTCATATYLHARTVGVL